MPVQTGRSRRSDLGACDADGAAVGVAGQSEPAGAQRSQARMTIMANDKMMAQMSRKRGFIAALDQSGGSTPAPCASTAFPTAPTAATPRCSS